MPTTLYLWLCPLCGRATGRRATKRVKYHALEQMPYLQTIKFDPDKAFGVILQINGPKQITKIRDFQPGEDPDNTFPQVKQRLLDAVSEWKAKGWLTREDILAAIS